MRTLSAAVLLAVMACFISPPAVAQAPGPPDWMQKIDPAKYVLLAADLKAPFAYGTDPQVQAQGQGIGLKDAQGHVTEQTVFFMYAMQTVKLAQPFANTANTAPPTPMRWDLSWMMTVGIYQNEEVAKAAVRTHYLSQFQFATEDENCLNDPRLRKGRGAAGANGTYVRYRNLLLKIDMENIQEIKGKRELITAELWNRAHDDAQKHQYDLIPALARLWLDKVAGPDRADLHVQADRVVMRWWQPNAEVEREPVADRQYVRVMVDNASDTVTAVGAEARLLLARQGQAEMQPIGRPVRLPDIPPKGSRPAIFYWDLDGKNLENAVLRVAVEIPRVEDDDMTDNQCDLKCSIYTAFNGTTAFRWVDDSYAFGNYGFEQHEGQEMVEGILATVIGQLYTDPKASALLQRMLFPQTYTRFVSYLRSSMTTGAGGHCYGLSATAAAYFLDNSLRPAPGRTCDLTRDLSSVNVNLYQRAQLVPVAEALLSGEEQFARNWGAIACLNTVRNILKTQRRPVVISISGNAQVQHQVIVNGQPQMQMVNERWGHALLAYKLVEVEGRPTAIYVYDPNIPPRLEWATQNPSTAFGINANGSWFMTTNMQPWYGGVDAIAAREVTREVSLAEANAVMPVLRAKLAELRGLFDKAAKIMAVLHCPADALFTDPQGRRVGTVEGKAVNDVPGAEIWQSGEAEIYLLPRDVQFSVQITGTGQGQAGFDVLRSKAGEPEIVVFDKLPLKAGERLKAVLAKGGVIDSLTGADGEAHTPTLVGTLKGDRAVWQTGSQEPVKPPTEPVALTLTGGTSSIPGPTRYPTERGTLRLRVNYTAPGTVLDTVGINAATPGDFAIKIDGAGRPSLCIYYPALVSPHRVPNGWHVFEVDDRLQAGQWYTLEATWGDDGVTFKSREGHAVHDPVRLKLSGKPVFIGDFPGDEAWGTRYNIHQSFIGQVADLTIR